MNIGSKVKAVTSSYKLCQQSRIEWEIIQYKEFPINEDLYDYELGVQLKILVM